MRILCLLALPYALAAQVPEARPELAQAAAQSYNASLTKRYPAIEAPESIAINASLQRVASRLGAGTLNFVLVGDMDSEADEAIPAGDRLLVSTELIRRAKDDDELAGMLAHALAHAGQPPLETKGLATVPVYFYWPAPGGATWPLPIRKLGAERERQADATAIETLGRAGIDPSGLPRYLERARVEPERLAALRTHIAFVTTATTAPPLTSECEVIQALLDELAGKKPTPSLLR